MKQHLTICSPWLNEILLAMKEVGLDVESLTKELPELHTYPDTVTHWVPVSTVRSLWHRAVELSGNRSLGFQVGKQVSVRAFGVLSTLICHSPNLATALDQVSRYQSLVSQSGRFDLQVHQGQPVLCYIPAECHIPIHIAQIESVVTASVAAIRKLVREKPFFSAIEFMGERPTYAREYERFFDCEIHFEKPQVKIYPRLAELNAPIHNTDPHLFASCRSLAENQLSLMDNIVQLHQSVKESIALLGYNSASLDRVSDKIGMTPRTLQRKLEDSGASYRQIWQETVLTEAVHRLQLPNASIKQVATALGYEETSTFTRAIKRWSGKTPGQWRHTTLQGRDQQS